MPARIMKDDDERYIEYMREGMTAELIAKAEQKSFHTVKSRIQRIYRDYGVSTRAQLLSAYIEQKHARALRNDLIEQQLAQILGAWLDTRVATVDVLSIALQLAFDVRISPPNRTRQRLRRWLAVDIDRSVALLMTLAALVPLDQSPDRLLRWLIEHQSARRVPTATNGNGPTTEN